MRVIVISVEPYLSGFFKMANKKLDIAAIIIPSTELLKNVNINFTDGRTSKIYSYVYLKECLENKYYDYVIVAMSIFDELMNIVLKDLENLGIAADKILQLGNVYSEEFRSFGYVFNQIKNSVTNYKIIITGISYAASGTDISSYEMPTLSCAMPSQDIYYDYLCAKKIFGMENSKFKYAVIGMAPYSFHYDFTRTRRGGVVEF